MTSATINWLRAHGTSGARPSMANFTVLSNFRVARYPTGITMTHVGLRGSSKLRRISVGAGCA